MSAPAVQVNSDLADILEKVQSGQRLSLDDAARIFRSDDVLSLGWMANLVRERRHGDMAYYNLNAHIEPTNVCVLARVCKFCAFGKRRDEEGAYTLSADEILARAEQLHSPGVSEFHIVGGLHPELKLEFFEDLLSRLKSRFPGVHLKCLTALEIEHIARISHVSVRECLERLKEAGLDSLPGGGAETFSERARNIICRGKLSPEKWMDVHRTAHDLGLRSNATMLYGHVETPEERAEHLVALRALQDETGGFLAFVPLAYHPENNPLGEQVRYFTTGLDDLRVIAGSRLILDNFDHIKAYWVMVGPKLAQVALRFGADDIHGTVVEERISHDAGARTPGGLTETQLIGLIRQAGRIPVRRDSLYQKLEVMSQEA
jgi:aminodeoxyfutalosine synthase